MPNVIINVLDKNKESGHQTGCSIGVTANAFLTFPHVDMGKNVTGKLSEEKKKNIYIYKENTRKMTHELASRCFDWMHEYQ